MKQKEIGIERMFEHATIRQEKTLKKRSGQCGANQDRSNEAEGYNREVLRAVTLHGVAIGTRPAVVQKGVVVPRAGGCRK
jgi:hypothetical protein